MDSITDTALPNFGSSRFWVVANPTGGGGRGEEVIQNLVTALRATFGASMALVEWKHQDLAERANPPTGNPSVIVLRTERERHSVEIAESIVQTYLFPSAAVSSELTRPTDVMVAIGGDGTLSEVVNGMCRGTVKSSAALRDSRGGAEAIVISKCLPRLVYLAAGTGADFSRLGYCCRTVDDVVSVVSGLVVGAQDGSRYQSFRIDVGSVLFPTTGTRRYFINECSVGISCDVILRSERYKKSWLRFLGGTIIFFAAAIVALVQLKPTPMRLRRLPSEATATPVASSTAVKCPSGKDGRVVRLTPQEIQQDSEIVGQWVDFPASTIAFANGKYFGGGMMVAPHGDPTDQLFALTVWYATFWPFVLRLYGVYSGSHTSWSSTTTLEGKRFEVDVKEGSAEKQFCEMDGELGEELPAVVEFMGNVLMLRPNQKRAS